MSYMYAYGTCCSCHRMFGFNPERVPSTRVEGIREPVCRSCVEAANPERIRRGLEPIEILPGAYEPEDVNY